MKAQLLNTGGYELMFVEHGQRELQLIPVGNDGLTVDFVSQFIGQGKVYIRPIQSVIELTKSETTAADVIGPGELYNNCLDLVPLSQLRAHTTVSSSSAFLHIFFFLF